MKEYIRKNKEILLLAYLPIYLIWFMLAEKFITDDYYVSYMAFDDKIPFIPVFVLPYVLWYPYILAPIPALYLKDRPAYVRYGIYLITTLSISLFVCCVFPNGQNLRVSDTGGGFLGSLISALYAADTNTNVLPSMHVVTSLGTAMAYFDSRNLRKFAVPSLILALLICAATVFIKQHSFLDVIWGAVMAAAAGICIYILPRMRKRKHFPGKGRHIDT